MTTTETITPKLVSGLELAFGPSRVGDYLPAWEKIPDEFKRFDGKWQKVVSDWFFCGLHGAKWTPKPGIDTRAALAHIKVCLASWEPPHEHKEAGVAYLLSLWFEGVTYKAGKPNV